MYTIKRAQRMTLKKGKSGIISKSRSVCVEPSLYQIWDTNYFFLLYKRLVIIIIS